jgi:hypothetical protein
MINYILGFDVLGALQNYGVIFTILLLAISVAYLIIKNSTKRIREQEEKIDKLYGRIDNLMNKFSTPDNAKTELTGKFINYAENSNKIQIQLYHLLQNFGADRISIYEFHNGGKNLAGVEFKKCSNSYEAVSLEIKPNIKEMQNLPLSINPLWNKILATREEIIIPSTENLEDSFLRGYLESQSIHTYYATILQDYDNTPVGFITIEYYKHTHPLTQQQLDEFYEIAIKISVLINLK